MMQGEIRGDVEMATPKLALSVLEEVSFSVFSKFSVSVLFQTVS